MQGLGSIGFRVFGFPRVYFRVWSLGYRAKGVGFPSIRRTFLKSR